MLRILSRPSAVHRLANRPPFLPRSSPFTPFNAPRNYSTRSGAQYPRFFNQQSGRQICMFHMRQCAYSLVPVAYTGMTRSHRHFHYTARAQHLPLVSVLASVLKVRIMLTDTSHTWSDFGCPLQLQTSTAMDVARTVVRVTLTFIPLLLLKNHKWRRHLAVAEASGDANADRKSFVLRKIRYGTILVHLLLFTPAVLFWLTMLASAERTPLTGR